MIPEIDLAAVFIQLELKFQKDELHISMFIATVAKKSVEIAQQQAAQLTPFATAASILVGDWIHKATHLQFPKDMMGDPFKPLRDETRIFAQKWALDPAFIKALG